MESFYFLEKALLSLNKSEYKQFEKFVTSEYFKKKHTRIHTVFIFYKLIKNNILKPHKKFNDAEWCKIIKCIYSNKNKDALFYKKNLSLLKSELLTYLLNFFVIESFVKDTLLYEISILNELKKRNLTDIFDHFCKSDRFNKLNNHYSETQELIFTRFCRHEEKSYFREKELLKNGRQFIQKAGKKII